VIFLTFRRRAIGWWRGRGLVGFQAQQTLWVEPALARYFVACGAAQVEHHTTHEEREGIAMHTWVTHGIERVTVPAIEPVTLAEVKQFLRVDQTTEDGTITPMIAAARDAAERYLGVSLITQSWKLTLQDYLPPLVALRFGPVQSITSVTLIPVTGSNQVIAASGYRLTADKRGLEVTTPITGNRFEIIYQAGYGSTASAVPELIRQGILQHVAAMYDMRSADAVLPARALTAYHPYKEMSL
jgi:uncharacterized phiE125 gp8 family phage protein